jgi:hypothetical protein
MIFNASYSILQHIKIIFPIFTRVYFKNNLIILYGVWLRKQKKDKNRVFLSFSCFVDRFVEEISRYEISYREMYEISRNVLKCLEIL